MTKRLSSASRRTFLAGAASGLAGVGMLTHPSSSERAQARSSSSSEHWTQYRATAAHTAYRADSSGPTGNITEAWTDPNGRFTDGIAVVNGTVYTGLRALDATDGTERWSIDPTIPNYDYPDAPIADGEYPAVMDGTVYVTIRFGPYDADEAYAGALIAVDAHTGNKRWRIDTPGGITWTQFQPVTATDRTIFTHGPGLDSGEDDWLYAFAPDRSIRWKRRTDTTPPSPLTVADGRVYLPSKKGVQALNAATGETVWTALPRIDVTATPMMSNGTLFATEEQPPGVTLIALDAATGEEHWRTAYPSPGSTDESLYVEVDTADADTVYLQTNTVGADVVALDRTDGSERWRATLPQPSETAGEQHTIVPNDGLARVGGLLYVGGAALDPTDGSTVWTHRRPASYPFGYWLSAVAGGRVYLGGDEIVVLRGTTGQTTETPTETPTATEVPPEKTLTSATETPAETATQSTAPPLTQTHFPTATEPSTASPTATGQPTATEGPGFGVLTALGGVGLGVWRALARKDEE